MDGVVACPFVAFDNDRDERSARPDRRHRCYAELRPAPRSIAHQEAYCLSASFAACPTFQDWARRESARPSPGAAADDGAGIAAAGRAEDVASRQPASHDWATPPPWASGGGEPVPPATAADRGSTSTPSAGAPLPGFLSGRDRPVLRSADDEEAGGEEPDESEAPEEDEEPEEVLRAAARTRPMGPSAVSAGVPVAGRARRPSAGASDQPVRRRPPEPDPEAPAWERPRRFEAYPTLRTRVGLPRISPLAGAVIALILGALALFFLPPVLLDLARGGPNSGGAAASATPSASPSAAASPTAPSPSPGPTSQVYVVKQGDTLSKIAERFGLTLDQLLAANKNTIKNPDKIAIGDQIVIPAQMPSEIPGATISGESPSPSPSP